MVNEYIKKNGQRFAIKQFKYKGIDSLMIVKFLLEKYCTLN